MKLEEDIYKIIEDNKFINVNGLMLTKKEIDILNKYNINYQKCKSLKEVLYEIEKAIDFLGDIEQLDSISATIAERDYYQNTNK